MALNPQYRTPPDRCVSPPEGDDRLALQIGGWKAEVVDGVVSLLAPHEQALFGVETDARQRNLSTLSFGFLTTPDNRPEAVASRRPDIERIALVTPGSAYDTHRERR